MKNTVHRIEPWTNDMEATTPSFGWLFAILDWTPNHDPARPTGRIWQHPSGVYLVPEQSPDIFRPLERTHADLSHLALRTVELMID